MYIVHSLIALTLSGLARDGWASRLTIAGDGVANGSNFFPGLSTAIAIPNSAKQEKAKRGQGSPCSALLRSRFPVPWNGEAVSE
jgi:hypothetical protein